VSGLGFVEVDYIMRLKGVDPAGFTPVRGVQVGRFAIRHAAPGSHQSYFLPSVEDAPWRVDHIPTGYAISAFDNFEDAYALADDISRFSKSDPSSKDPKRVGEQVGPQIRAWLKAIYPDAGMTPKYIPYRQWLAEQGKEWKPRRRKMGSLF
jgi:hypothetical protein